MNQVLLYVNQVYADDYTGQGTFERELIAALRQRVDLEPSMLLRVFTVHRPGDTRPELSRDCISLLLDKRRPWGYLAHQMRLCWALARALLRHWQDDVTVYARNAPSSVAPVALATLFRRRLVIRSGPTLANLVSFDKHPGPLTLGCIRLGFWWNCRQAYRIVVVTERIRRYLHDLYPFTLGKVTIVPNGVSVQRMPVEVRDRRRWGLSDSGLVLGFVGHLYVEKGLDTVIRALAEVRRQTGAAPQLLVVGDGPCKDAWQALAQQLGIGATTVFAGQRRHAEVASAIAACDVMLAPHTRSTLMLRGSSSMKLFEYLACNRPVLASSSEDHQFLVDYDVGWLAEPDNVHNWTTAIRQLTDEAGLADIGDRGRRLVEEHYSFAQVAGRIWSTCFEQAEDMSSTVPEGSPLHV